MKTKKKVRKYTNGVNAPRLGINSVSNPLDGATLSTYSAAETGAAGGGMAGAMGSIPLIGQMYQIGSAMGSAARSNPTSTRGQITSDLVNPSHGFMTALETGNIKDAIPILGAFNRRDRARNERDEAERLLKEKQERQASFNATQRGIALAGQTNNFQGQNNTGFYKNGVSDKKIINDEGLKLLNGGKQQLSDDMFQAKGAKHSDGGIDVDYDNDNSVDVEIEGDEVVDTTKGRVYSDNIKPDMNTLKNIKSQIGLNLKGTFADVSKKLAQSKEKLESKGDSRFEQNTKKIMLDRINNSEELLFNDQQSKNGNQTGEEFKDGGRLNSNGNYIEEDGHAQYVYGVPYTSRANAITQPIRGINNVTNPVPNGYFAGAKEGDSSFNQDMNQLKMAELKNDYNSFKRRGDVPKYVHGGQHNGLTGDPQYDYASNYIDPNASKIDEIGYGERDLARQQRKDIRNEKFQNFNNSVSSSLTTDNLTNAANFVSPILGNIIDRQAIKRLKTDINPSLIEAQPFVFNDTTSARERKNAEASRQMLNNINAGSTQTQVAAKAALLANRLRADNDVNISELQRKDQYLGHYRDTEFRRNAINSQTINSVNEDNLNRRNNIVVQRQAANNALQSGIVNAIQAYNINKNEKTKMGLTTLLLRDPAMYDRIKNDNPKLFKELFG